MIAYRGPLFKRDRQGIDGLEKILKYSSESTSHVNTP